MENYYDDVIQEIKDKLNHGELEDASYLLKKELSMPYIPMDVEAQLKQLKRDLSYALSEHKNTHEESLEDLLSRLLNGKAKAQLAAADALQNRNLRNCIDEIKTYLAKDPCPEASALIVEALAEQEINDEFVLRRNGLEFTFWADEVTPVAKSKGFLLALRQIENDYAKDPSLEHLARTLLIHEAYMYLPLSYEENEVNYLIDIVEGKLNELIQSQEIE